MRVLCIDDSERPNTIETNCDFEVIEGRVYHVYNEWISEDKIRCYSLEEDPERDAYGFEADRFIPLSNIDETELLKERQENECTV